MSSRPGSESDWYAVLGVSPVADEAAIKAAHRHRARDLHPDVNPAPDATERMAELNRARDVLLDPAQRVAFDRTRQRAASAGSQQTARTRSRRTEPNETDERMRFTFGHGRQPNPAADRGSPPRPGAHATAREAARWRVDPAAGPNREDWYSFLELAPWCTGEEVRRSCERLAKEATGPHLTGEERARRAAKLRDAAETLANPERKKAYDESRPPWKPKEGPLADYYGLLGIRRRATLEEIAEAVTSAHLALGKIRTPESRAKDAAIREAYWVLRDPARRSAYDSVRSVKGD